ncbi:LD-carboxypeptidase [Polyangium sp. y55x31]|uniref:S66 peptidase family protein n=1 Tax=Polyangium sp. y55x31 TaxID=3042688 RepID=UPI0024832152|nr:LD-carboxypeptidase [Polyangium sp. y55x31]MDI1478105.1 LD-carboxypeptidase [Polyangium sp. y55x31]
MLKPHATIAVVAPAGIPQLAGVAAGVKLVESWGYEVVLAPNLEKRHHFTAGTAEVRTQDLRWALTAEGIDAVWLARGGYGCMHCLPNLPSEGLDGRPVIGCSDATALFAALVKSRGGKLVHGPMLETIATKVDDATRARIQAMLAGEEVAPIAAEHFVGPKEEVRGRVVGGNLCVLASLSGTPWALDARGAIVVLEEVTEVPYRVDRLITQLRLSGALDGAVGIALGDFVKCDPPEGAGYELTDVLREALAPLGLPVWSRLTLGHDKRNLAFCIGEEGSLGAGGLAQARAA